MRILVTGASGFAGNIIANQLLNLGHDVLGIVNKNTAHGDFSMKRCDLSVPWSIEGTFDIIIHTAGILPHQAHAFVEFYRGNVAVMENLVDYAVKHDIKRVINLSTIGVYGEFRKEIISEEADIINPDAYGLTKYVAECLLRNTSAIRSISLRLPGIIGPGIRGVWLSDLAEKMEKNMPLTIYTPNFLTKNFVWVYDLASFVAKLIAMSAWEYDVINIACQESTSVAEIVYEMKKGLESTSEIIIDDSVRNPFCLNPQKALKMGYSSLPPLEIARRYCRIRKQEKHIQ